MPDAERYVEKLLAQLRERRVAVDERVARALRRVPRHLFVERFWVTEPGGAPTQAAIEHDPDSPLPEHLERIYADEALLTRMQDGMGTSSSSQLSLMVDMLRLLALEPGMRVLEIGAGTGFNAALMADLVRPDGAPSADGDRPRVVTLDIQPDVVEQAERGFARLGLRDVRAISRDGFDGAPEHAPFDRIVATVGVTDVSPQWVAQLAPGGFMLLPLRHADANPLVRVQVVDGNVVGQVVGFSGFMAVQGALADPRYYRRGVVSGAPESDSREPSALHRVERPVPPELRVTGRAWLGFWFYLGLRDERAVVFTWMSEIGLRDPETGAEARIDTKRIAGDAALVERLEALHTEWRALGGPGIKDFRVRFVPNDSPAPTGAPERTWNLTGKYHRREFFLP